MSRLVLLQSVVFCFVLHTAERDSSAGERGHRAGQSAGSKRETHTHTHTHASVFTGLLLPSGIIIILLDHFYSGE